MYWFEMSVTEKGGRPITVEILAPSRSAAMKKAGHALNLENEDEFTAEVLHIEEA